MPYTISIADCSRPPIRTRASCIRTPSTPWAGIDAPSASVAIGHAAARRSWGTSGFAGGTFHVATLSPEIRVVNQQDTGRNGAAPGVLSRHARLVPFVVACAFFMEQLDSSVLSTVLPVIAADFAMTPLRLNLAITSYLLSVAVFIPASGWVADRFGTRKVFCASCVLFTLGSVACGAAHTLPELVAARIVQGAGGALAIPVGRLILLRAFPASQYIRAMSYVTIPALVGPVVGPLVGGAIATYASWRCIFYINLPVGLAGAILAWRYLDDEPGRPREPLDFPGFVLCAAGLGALQTGFESVHRHAGNSPATAGVPVAAFLAAAACMVLYARHMPRHANPIVDLRLFRERGFRIGTLAGGLCRVSLGAIPFLLPLYLQTGFGLSPIESGSLTFLIAAGSIGLKTTVTIISARFGLRSILCANGVLLGALTMSLSALSSATAHWILALLFCVYGFLRSLQFTTMNALAYADLPHAMQSQGTTLGGIAQQLFPSFGVAVATTLLSALAGDHGLPGPRDFSVVFLVLGLFPVVAAVWFARLAASDGAAASGHRRTASSPS
ncbi:DHA2 family efflux MFS transporter permease subunit [Burkholderia contaminans]|nr:DHA2 family efflux MFS transporter permease subunit [Burkholderia contaminans]